MNNFQRISYPRIQYNTRDERYELTNKFTISLEKYEEYSKCTKPYNLESLYYSECFSLLKKPEFPIKVSARVFEDMIIKSYKSEVNSNIDISLNQNVLSKIIEKCRRIIINSPTIFELDKYDGLLSKIGDKFYFSDTVENIRELVEILDKTYFSIYIGGPGTGKTTEVCKKIRDANRVAVISLSNKAGAHFKNKFSKTSENTCDFFSYTKCRYQEVKGYDYIVFEESSMLTTNELPMILEILKNNRSSAFIFLGDTNQLPGFLGLGNLFYSMVQHYPKNVYKMTIQHRMTKETLDESNFLLNNGYFLKVYSPTEYADNLKQIIRAYPDNFIITALENSVVDYYNNAILKNYYNADDLSKIPENQEVRCISRTNLYVKETHNGKEKKVMYFFNGEFCKVKKLGQDQYEVSSSEFPKIHSKRILKTTDLLMNFEPGFAMTVHRAQGNEWDYVFLDDRSNERFRSLNLLYVGQTRSKLRSFVLSNNNVTESLKYVDFITEICNKNEIKFNI